MNEPTKRCPYCAEEILAAAKKCKHCESWLEEEPNQPVDTPTPPPYTPAPPPYGESNHSPRGDGGGFPRQPKDYFWLWFVGAVVAVALVVFGIVSYCSSSSGSNAREELEEWNAQQEENGEEDGDDEYDDGYTEEKRENYYMTGYINGNIPVHMMIEVMLSIEGPYVEGGWLFYDNVKGHPKQYIVSCEQAAWPNKTITMDNGDEFNGDLVAGSGTFSGTYTRYHDGKQYYFHLSK